MSDVYPPQPPAGVAPAMLPAPPAPKAEVAQLATTGGSHLAEVAGLASLILAAGIVLVVLARKVRA